MIISSNILSAGVTTSKIDHTTTNNTTNTNHLHHPPIINNASKVSTSNNNTTTTIPQDSFLGPTNPIRISNNNNNTNIHERIVENNNGMFRNVSDTIPTTNEESSFLSKSLGSHATMYRYRERIS